VPILPPAHPLWGRLYTDEVWWRYGISRSCDECTYSI